MGKTGRDASASEDSVVVLCVVDQLCDRGSTTVVGLVPSSRVTVGEWATGLPPSTGVGLSGLASVVSIVIVGLYQYMAGQLGEVGGGLLDSCLDTATYALGLEGAIFCVDWVGRCAVRGY